MLKTNLSSIRFFPPIYIRIQESEYRRKTLAGLFRLPAPVFSCLVVPASGMDVGWEKASPRG